jgi:glycosyltransferase involved in cell wall biosynthesis
MRIAIDARELLGHRTGVGRYLHELLQAWSADRSAHDASITLCAPAPIDLTPYGGLHVSMAQANGAGVWWEQHVLPRLVEQAGADVLFAPGYTAPLWLATPSVVVLHDVSFAAHPEWFTWKEGARRRTIGRLAAERATQVIAVSAFSKREIQTHFGITPSKISVIHNGVTPMRPSSGGSTEPPTVLFVGSIFNRRHVPLLIEAVAELGRRGRRVRLDIIGDNRTTPHVDLSAHATAVGLRDVVIRNYVADDELRRAYAASRAFAFLSEYEGFGLTPLEALSADVPPVVLDTPFTREIYGDDAVYASQLTVPAVTDALTQALFDEGTRTGRPADSVPLGLGGARHHGRPAGGRGTEGVTR